MCAHTRILQKDLYSRYVRCSASSEASKCSKRRDIFLFFDMDGTRWVTWRFHLYEGLRGKTYTVCIWNGVYTDIYASSIHYPLRIHLHTLNVDELTFPFIALRVELIPQISNLLSQGRIEIKLDRKLWDPEPTGTERVRQMTNKLSCKCLQMQ